MIDFSHYILGFKPSASGRRIAAPVPLMNGETISVQASETHYCSPADNDGPYVSFEVHFNGSFKGVEMLSLSKKESPYGWITQERLEGFIEANGGVDGLKMVATRLEGSYETK